MITHIETQQPDASHHVYRGIVGSASTPDGGIGSGSSHA